MDKVAPTAGWKVNATVGPKDLQAAVLARGEVVDSEGKGAMGDVKFDRVVAGATARRKTAIKGRLPKRAGSARAGQAMRVTCSGLGGGATSGATERASPKDPAPHMVSLLNRMALLLAGKSQWIRSGGEEINGPLLDYVLHSGIDVPEDTGVQFSPVDDRSGFGSVVVRRVADTWVFHGSTTQGCTEFTFSPDANLLWFDCGPWRLFVDFDSFPVVHYVLKAEIDINNDEEFGALFETPHVAPDVFEGGDIKKPLTKREIAIQNIFNNLNAMPDAEVFRFDASVAKRALRWEGLITEAPENFKKRPSDESVVDFIRRVYGAAGLLDGRLTSAHLEVLDEPMMASFRSWLTTNEFPDDINIPMSRRPRKSKEPGSAPSAEAA